MKTKLQRTLQNPENERVTKIKYKVVLLSVYFLEHHTFLWWMCSLCILTSSPFPLRAGVVRTADGLDRRLMWTLTSFNQYIQMPSTGTEKTLYVNWSVSQHWFYHWHCAAKITQTNKVIIKSQINAIFKQLLMALSLYWFKLCALQTV